jgi:hypothetical protein
MLNVAVTVQNHEAALQGIREAERAPKRAELRAAVAVAARETVRGHIIAKKGSYQNKLGGTSTQFYARMADAVVGMATADGAEVTNPFPGAALHYYGSAGLPGGVVRPSGRMSAVTGKPIQFLTIAKHPAAHGKRASDFRALYAVPGGLRLMQGAARSDSDPLYFIFARSATIKADPSLLPEQAVIEAAVKEAIEDTIEDMRNAGGTQA